MWWTSLETGRKYRIKSPLEDGDKLVRSHFKEDLVRQGSIGHWTWVRSSPDDSEPRVMAESIPVRGSNDWWLRLYKPKEEESDAS